MHHPRSGNAPALPVGKRRFIPLFWTQFLGAFNDNFFKSSLLTLAVFYPERFGVEGVSSAAFGSLASGLFILPFFLFSAAAGEAADAFDKARMAVWCKAASCVIAVLGAAAFGFACVPLLLAVLFLNGAQSATFGPVKYAILPQHLPEEELMSANAKVETATFLAILSGAMAGGAAAGAGESAPIWCASIFAAVSAASFMSSRFIPAAPPAPEAGTPVLSPWRALARLRRSLKGEGAAVKMIPHISFFWALGAAFLSQFPVLAKETFHSGTGTVTLFLGLFSAGIGLGSALCGLFLKGKPSAAFSGAALAACGVFACLFCVLAGMASPAADPDLWTFLADPMRAAAALCLTGTAAAGGAFVVPLYTVMQDAASPGKRARVIAANNILNALAMAVTALTLPALYGAGLHPSQALLGMAALCFPAAYACRFLTPSREGQAS